LADDKSFLEARIEIKKKTLFWMPHSQKDDTIKCT
jgi:hypothetical protein